MTSRWYVIETRPRAEHHACEQLRLAGFETLLPCFLKRRVIRNRLEQFRVPLFAGYAFVRCAANRDAWGAIASTRGVRHLFCRPDGTPIPLPEREAQVIVESFGAGPVDDLSAALAVFREGMTLRVTKGSFEHWEGPYVRSRAGRVWILLKLLGGERSVEFMESQVEVVR